MTSIIHANLDNISVFVPRKIKLTALNKRRWSSAFVLIYCSRAFRDVLTSHHQGKKTYKRIAKFDEKEIISIGPTDGLL